MPFDERWQRLTPPQWGAFAREWLAEVRADDAAGPEPEGPDGDAESAGDPDAPLSIGERVTMVSFFARPAEQWSLIRAAMTHAETDVELGAIAAGPVEHLLGWHGAETIDEIERWAAADPRVARMLTGVWQYLMSDEIWARIRAIQRRVPDPLPAYRPEAPSGPSSAPDAAPEVAT